MDMWKTVKKRRQLKRKQQRLASIFRRGGFIQSSFDVDIQLNMRYCISKDIESVTNISKKVSHYV